MHLACLQVLADYSVPHLTLKTGVGLTSQPKVDVAFTTGYKDVIFGGEATYDSAKNDLTKWSAGVGKAPAPCPMSWLTSTIYLCCLFRLPKSQRMCSWIEILD